MVLNYAAKLVISNDISKKICYFFCLFNPFFQGIMRCETLVIIWNGLKWFRKLLQNTMSRVIKASAKNGYSKNMFTPTSRCQKELSGEWCQQTLASYTKRNLPLSREFKVNFADMRSIEPVATGFRHLVLFIFLVSIWCNRVKLHIVND